MLAGGWKENVSSCRNPSAALAPWQWKHLMPLQPLFSLDHTEPTVMLATGSLYALRENNQHLYDVSAINESTLGTS